MSGLPLGEDDGGGRYPGFSTLAQAKHWDRATAAVVQSRLGLPPDVRFFTPAEEAGASALFDQLLDQHAEPRVPVVNMVDARLAEEQTDGWHYGNMPRDGEAWRVSPHRPHPVSGGLWYNAKAADRSGRCSTHVLLSMAVGAVALVISVTTGDNLPFLAVTLISIAVAGALAYDGPFWASASRAMPVAVAGTAMGLINAVGNLGGFVGPYVGGYLQDLTHGSFLATSIFLACCLLAARPGDAQPAPRR